MISVVHSRLDYHSIGWAVGDTGPEPWPISNRFPIDDRGQSIAKKVSSSRVKVSRRRPSRPRSAKSRRFIKDEAAERKISSTIHCPTVNRVNDNNQKKKLGKAGDSHRWCPNKRHGTSFLMAAKKKTTNNKKKQSKSNLPSTTATEHASGKIERPSGPPCQGDPPTLPFRYQLSNQTFLLLAKKNRQRVSILTWFRFFLFWLLLFFSPHCVSEDSLFVTLSNR